MKIGYVRVSKQEQHEALQIDARHAKLAVTNGLWTR
jgi:DNA invertase Pin-like site-specific DNA recombinase